MVTSPSCNGCFPIIFSVISEYCCCFLFLFFVFFKIYYALSNLTMIFFYQKNIYIYISLCWIVSGERPFVNFIYPSACLSNNYPNVPPNIYFFTWIPVLGYGILQGESVGKKFRDAFFPRVMVLGRHFLALGPWRRLIL